MKTFRRFTLLGSFAAVGVGLAICVAVSADPSGKSSGQSAKQEPKTLVAWATTSGDPDEDPQGPGRGRSAPADKSASSPILGPGPVIAETYPVRGNRFSAPADQKDLEKALEYLQQRMSPMPGATAIPPPPGPKLPEAIPAPAPAAGPVIPAPVSASPSPRGIRPIVKADPEGNGKLVIHIQNSDLREVLDLLAEQGGLNILAGKDVQGRVSANLAGVDIDSALGAILKSTGYTTRRQGKYLFVGTPEEFNSMEQSLDRIGTRVYRPNYVTASELKQLIQPLLTEKTGVVSVSSAAEAGIAANDTTVGGDKYAGGDVVLVRDYEAVLAQVDQTVAEIDIRPLQVAIEAMILGVKLSDTDTFGINFELLRDHMQFGWGTPLSAMKDLTFKGGLKFGYLDSNVGAFVDALEQIADTNVIATPRLMVLNKHRAEILIGEKKGYVSTTVTETASTQAVDFLEIGAQLRLRPFISRNGMVRMEVHPELSDGNVQVTDKFTLPNKTITEVTTNILVRDGCTVVIGGLIKEQLTNSTTAIPVLGSLPWVGPLFRNTTETKEKQEIIVLITPRIIYEPGSCQEGEKAACEFHRRQAVYSEKMSPLGKRSIGHRYFRLAQAAWEKGDRNTALRFAEMSVHFDPLSREAIDLRSDIWQGKRFDDHTLSAGPASASPDQSPEGPDLTGWMLNDLQRDAGPQTVSLHPLDPGQPGTHTDIVRPRRLE